MQQREPVHSSLSLSWNILLFVSSTSKYIIMSVLQLYSKRSFAPMYDGHLCLNALVVGIFNPLSVAFRSASACQTIKVTDTAFSEIQSMTVSKQHWSIRSYITSMLCERHWHGHQAIGLYKWACFMCGDIQRSLDNILHRRPGTWIFQAPKLARHWTQIHHSAQAVSEYIAVYLRASYTCLRNYK